MIDPSWFLGEVVNISDDPEKLGRVRVKVYSKHDTIKNDEDLIWSHVMMPTTSESLRGVGLTPSLAVGSKVVGFYADGSSMRVSIITGTLLFNPLEDSGSSEHSLSYLARGKNSVTKSKIGFEEPATSFAAEYPFNRVLQTKSGHVIEVDDTSGNERIHVYHKAGSYIEMNKDGQITIVSTGNMIEIVGSDKLIEVKGNAKIAVEGDLDASVIGNATIACAGNLFLGSLGNLSISAGEHLTLSAGTGITLKSPAGVVTTGSLSVSGSLSSSTGATGSFATPTGKIVSVAKGLVTQVQ